jgi:hypothetical protein
VGILTGVHVYGREEEDEASEVSWLAWDSLTRLVLPLFAEIQCQASTGSFPSYLHSPLCYLSIIPGSDLFPCAHLRKFFLHTLSDNPRKKRVLLESCQLLSAILPYGTTTTPPWTSSPHQLQLATIFTFIPNSISWFPFHPLLLFVRVTWLQISHLHLH